VFERAVDGYDIFMLDSSRLLSFLHDERSLVAGHDFRGKDPFQGDSTLERTLVSKVDLGHPATPQQSHHEVAVDVGAFEQARRLGGLRRQTLIHGVIHPVHERLKRLIHGHESPSSSVAQWAALSSVRQ